MPIYEYKCPCCGKEIELLQNYDDPEPDCDLCSGDDQDWERKENTINDNVMNPNLSNEDVDLMVSWVIREKKKVDKNPIQQKIKMKRMISQTSFQLLGDGWYKDGYGGNKP